MNESMITAENIREFGMWLKSEERSDGTIEKYIRDITLLSKWLGENPLTKSSMTAWKDYLRSTEYTPATVNSMLAAANTFCRFAGMDFKARLLKIQKRMFCDKSRELTRKEYERLVETARRNGKKRLALIMETIGATGIRVSELKYITVESARTGVSEVSLKGKIRTILLPGKLCRKLMKYAKKQRIASGEIFVTGGGRSISRKQIWAEMKGLCETAGVAAEKVFPHNLRHLFARTFYKATKDVARLADILGHSSIETTRIYLLSSGQEHMRLLERLRLVC